MNDSAIIVIKEALEFLKMADECIEECAWAGRRIYNSRIESATRDWDERRDEIRDLIQKLEVITYEGQK